MARTSLLLFLLALGVFLIGCSGDTPPSEAVVRKTHPPEQQSKTSKTSPVKATPLNLSLDRSTLENQVLREKKRVLLDNVSKPTEKRDPSEKSKDSPIVDTLSSVQIDLRDDETPIIGFQFQEKSKAARKADAKREENLKSYHPIQEEREGQRLSLSEVLSGEE